MGLMQITKKPSFRLHQVASLLNRFLEKNADLPQEEVKSPLLLDRRLPYKPVYKQLKPEAHIGEGVTMQGTFKFDHCLRIDGHFEGDFNSEGKLIVGPKGYVRANIELEEAHIYGTIYGNIHVKKLVLRGNALIHGDITADTIVKDESVQIEGSVRIGEK